MKRTEAFGGPMHPRLAHHRPRRLLTDGGEDGSGGFEDGFFHALVERVGVGVAVYDESGTITYANDALASLLGLAPSDVIGRALWELDDGIDRAQFSAYWDSIEPGETCEQEIHYAKTDGDTVPVEVRTTAMTIEGSHVHVATVTDATDRVEDWAEMERQDERLSEIASVLSHDLRNPLNVAMGRADLAAMDVDSEHFEYVERSLEKMEALITDVLTLTREGSRITDPAPVELAAAVADGWRAVGDEDDATLAVEDGLGTVASSGDRLAVLFEELFENAIEHGGADVAITVGRLSDGFFVADDGPGIPADRRADVLEYGYSTSERGTGFGLCIVTHVATAHGWTVSITESDDGGTRVEVCDVEFHDRERRF